jgi:hypothetical protein
MFRDSISLIETYLNIIIHPFRIHDQWRHSIPIWSDPYQLPKITFPEALSISWFFWILGAIFQLLLIQYSLHLILDFQSESAIWDFFISQADALFPYYLLIFSLLLDLIFFPIIVLVQSEVMAFVIKFYAKLLHYEGSKEEMADQIITASLSAHFFSFIPILGKFFVLLSYYFLIYAGLRRNLGASRPLSFIIMATPMAVTFAMFMMFILFIFCLVQL